MKEGHKMAQFLLLLHSDPTDWLKMPAGDQQKWMRKYMAWGEKAQQGGFLVGSNKLVDDGGKIVRGQKALVTDGPYSETKEVLGGYYMIEAKNYEEAVQRSKDHPHLEHGGTIEVRQIEQLPR
jgi:hypothetical protein